jgi:hypothetical protein
MRESNLEQALGVSTEKVKQGARRGAAQERWQED